MNLKSINRNQIVLFVVALMLITAGYLNYSMQATEVSSNAISENEVAGIGDAKLVSSNNLITKDIDSNIITKETSAEVNEQINAEEDDYFASSRLGRNTMYSQMIESYQNLLENNNVGEEQKTIATQEITNINNIQNSIMICENLIKTKGIEDLVIFVNGDSINVIVKEKELDKEKIAQIQNIITRELEADIGNIHIMNK